MSELIDRNVLKAKMYQEAFESDTDMQKWDSGCWIRYKLFEKVVDSTPTVPYGPRWHRVEEELPEKNGAYAACWLYSEKYYWEKAIFWDGKWKLSNGNGLMEPDYWMPLPEPPKEDA